MDHLDNGNADSSVAHSEYLLMTESVGNREQNADDQICKHALAGLLPEPDGTLAVTDFNFCPNCGEKL